MLGLLAPPTRPRRPGLLTPVVFEQQSLDRLAGVNPILREMMMETERRADAQGIDFEISEGLRDRDRQAQLVAQGFSQTMNSQHLDGDATDIVVRNPDGSVTWDMPRYQEVADIAKAVAAEQGLDDFVWGGDWRSFPDGPHFQYNTGNNAPPATTMAAAPQSTPQASAPSGGANTPTLTGNAGQDTLQGGSMPQGLLSGPPQENRRPSIWDRVPGLGDPQRRARLAMAIEGMMLNPNQAIVQTAQDDLEAAREEERINRTAQWLRSQPGGGQFADAILAGMDANDVYGAYAESQRPPAPVEPMEVNGQLVNPQTGAVIGDYRTAEAPSNYTQMTGQQILAQFPGTNVDPAQLYNVSPTGQLTPVQGGTDAPLVDMSGASFGGEGESAYDEARGETFAERMASYETDASAARNAISNLDAMEALMDDPNFYSGTGGESVAAWRRLATSLGIDENKVESMESFNTLSKQAALDAMGGSLGAGFSNADRDFVEAQVANLGNTPEGNRRIIGIQRAIQERRLQVAQMAQDYERENGRLDNGFDRMLNEWAEQNPLFDTQQAGDQQGTQGGGQGAPDFQRMSDADFRAFDLSTAPIEAIQAWTAEAARRRAGG